MPQVKKARHIQVGPVDLTVAMPPQAADWVTSTPLYRKVVRPAFDRLGRPNGTTPAVVNPHVKVAPPDPAAATPEVRALIERIAGRRWYHTIDLGHGVSTPGFVDHREQLPYYSLPASLAGKRCLDIATFDGYWAFELERRGAAEVVAADISRWTEADVPRLMLRDPAAFGLDEETGGGFEIAADVLGSKVKRIETSVYDLNPEEVGMFDLVFISDLLVHLRDPQLALERAFAVCRGEIIVADVYTPTLDGFGGAALAQLTAPGETWWLMSVAALRLMMTVAGFEPVEEVSRFVLDADVDDVIHKVVLRGKAPETPSWYHAALEWKQAHLAKTAETVRARKEAVLGAPVNGTAKH